MTESTTLTCPACGTLNPVGSRFCNSCGTTLEAPASAAVETRKTVTILFIDATSSTALGERLDPESLRAVMTRYFDVMREVIEFHGGSVEKFIGDAVMAVFGVPTVHEDDALRACRAAIEIHERLGELDAAIRSERGASVEWRIGINTGEVVAGDTTAGQRIVTGDAVNVAARLEGAAAPGEILLGAETEVLVRDDVTADPVDALVLKGKAQPVPAWRLTAVSGSVGRRVRPLEAPLVGRHRPLRLLDEAFQEAVEERICHMFTIIGVAGVGKSRLVDEFVASLGDQARVTTGRCLAYGHGITYWPVAEAIRHGAGIGEEDPADRAQALLREVLAAEPEAGRVLAVIEHLLGITDSVPAPEDIFWAIRRTFEAMARGKPLILVFDDLHWGESTFLDLVAHIADWTRDAPILLVAMARPDLLEKRPAWGGGKRSATTIQLEALSKEESEELVGGLLGRAEIPPELRAQIGRASEGNPLFVEELLGKLIDDGFLVRQNDAWAALGDLRQLAVPPTIQALLAARLDGLGAEDRTVIERAAVEGKVFHRGAVTELAPEQMRSHVPDRLASLMRMELVRPDQASFAGDEAYRFRHLLIRDAAYQALAKQTRSELHQRFAGWLERVAADRLTEYEEIIAYHLEQAYRYRAELGPPDHHALELAARAGRLLSQAAHRADSRKDVAAVLELLERAMDLLPREGAERRLLVAQLAYAYLDGGDALKGERLLVDVLAESHAAGDDLATAWAELGLIVVRASTQATQIEDQIRDAERLRGELERLGDQSGTALADVIMSFALFSIGRAADGAKRARQIRDLEGIRPSLRAEAARTVGAASVWGPLPAEEAISMISDQREALGLSGAHLGLGRVLAMQGRFTEALDMVATAQQELADRGDRFLMAEAASVEGQIALLSGDVARAVSQQQAGYDGKIALGDRAFASTSAYALGQALLAAGNLDEAMRYATIALETSASDDIASQAGGRMVQAQVLSRRGDHAEAERLAGEAVEIMAATDYLWIHGQSLQAQAEVLHASGKVDEARTAAEAAIAVFERKGATFNVEVVRELIASWDR